MQLQLFILLVALSTELILTAQLPGCDISEYYQGFDPSAFSNSTQLKQVVHDLIDGHRVISYSRIDEAIIQMEGPSVVGIYSFQQYNNFPNDWNREHIWPRSRGVGDTGPDTSDLFHLYPAAVGLNSARSNKYFDECFNCESPVITPTAAGADGTSTSPDTWSPPFEVRGDLARAIFYMAVRYDGSDPETVDLQIKECSSELSCGSNTFGRLSTLMRWHEEDPVSEFERQRNELICRNFQGNRNPFVDFPDLANQLSSTFPGTSVAGVPFEFNSSPLLPLLLICCFICCICCCCPKTNSSSSQGNGFGKPTIMSAASSLLGGKIPGMGKLGGGGGSNSAGKYNQSGHTSSQQHYQTSQPNYGNNSNNQPTNSGGGIFQTASQMLGQQFSNNNTTQHQSEPIYGNIQHSNNGGIPEVYAQPFDGNNSSYHQATAYPTTQSSGLQGMAQQVFSQAVSGTGSQSNSHQQGSTASTMMNMAQQLYSATQQQGNTHSGNTHSSSQPSSYQNMAQSAQQIFSQFTGSGSNNHSSGGNRTHESSGYEPSFNTNSSNNKPSSHSHASPQYKPQYKPSYNSSTSKPSSGSSNYQPSYK